jgi:putative peptidoglycan lipid II flippase
VQLLARAWPRKPTRQIIASFQRPVAGAMLVVGTLTVVAKAAVVVKEAAVARQFGTGDALDAFFIALLLPSFAVSVVGGSLSSAFLPEYVRVRSNEGEGAADRLMGTVITCAGLLLFGLALFCLAAGLPAIRYLGSDFGDQKLRLTRTLFLLMLPMLVIGGISAIWAAALNATNRFAVVAGAPLLTPVIIIAVLLWRAPHWGIYALAAGTLTGAVAEAALIGYWVNRQHQRLLPAWYGLTPAVRGVLRQLAPMVAAGFLMSSATFIDQSMAARLGPGSVSAFNFGNRLVTGMLGVASVALGTAVFPHFARLVAARDFAGATASLRSYGKLIAVASVPVVLMFTYFSSDIIRMLFERGSFTSADTAVVGRIQAFSAVQIPFYLTGLLGVRFISSLQGNHVLVWIGIVNVVANIIGNILLSRMFGVAGIALSTTVVYALSCVMILLAIRKLLRSNLNQ